MRSRLAVVATRSRSEARVIALICLLLSLPLAAGGLVQPAIDADQRYVAELRVHTAAELLEILERAEAAVGTDIGDFEPIAVVLYGDEGRMFARDAYAANKYAVDLAARLDALRVVDIQICELWLDESGLTHSDMLPFVGFVPDGEAAVAELRRDGYRYF